MTTFGLVGITPHLNRRLYNHGRISSGEGGVAGRLGPEGDLLKGLGEGVHDGVGLAVAEALDGQLGGLFGVFGGVPQANDDAVVWVGESERAGRWRGPARRRRAAGRR